MDFMRDLNLRLSDAPMTDIMVDVETTGTNPSHGAVIQLAAIKFNFDTGAIGGTFNRCPAMAPGRFWDDDTRRWWGQQKPSILQNIISRAEPAEQVFRDYCAFASEGQPLRFWAKPLSFDWPFVASHLAQFGLMMPHRFWEARDLRSFIAGLLGCPGNVNMDHVSLEGDAHNALFDCALQLKQLLAAKDGDFNLKPIEQAA